MKTGSIRLIPILVGVIAVFGGQTRGQDYSHARIVRLSFVEGTVAIQRPDLTEWAEASVNTPIQEGFKLSTAQNGFAEVEFEDGSTLRVGQLGELDFTQLALESTGGKINRIALNQGYATFHVTPARYDLYEIRAGETTITVHSETNDLFRVDLDGDALRVEVFKGSVDFSGIYGALSLDKDQVLEQRIGADQPQLVTNGITKDDWDKWVERREQDIVPLQKRGVPSLYSNDTTDLLYGAGDLWNYGTWTYFPEFGYHGWLPRVSAGWTPYSIGRWCWYPGIGYVWISTEPWGWLPYHYGEWVFQPGIGWCWFPTSLNRWSPGVVNWYQGPDCIGWSPRSNVIAQGNNCPPGQTCHTFIKVDTFGSGRLISASNTLQIDPYQTRAVPGPQVTPTQQASLPGPAVSLGTIGVHTRVAGPAPARGNLNGLFGASTQTPAAQPAVPATPAQPGVVFDPASRRYVNNPAVVPAIDQQTLPAPVRHAGAPAPRGIWGASVPQGNDAITSRSNDNRGRGIVERPAPSGAGTPAPSSSGTPPAPHIYRDVPAFNDAPRTSTPHSPPSTNAPWGANSNSAPSQNHPSAPVAPSRSVAPPTYSAPAMPRGETGGGSSPGSARGGDHETSRSDSPHNARQQQ